MPFVVISASLNPLSRSRELAKEAFAALQELGQPAEYYDLRQMNLPACDATESYGNSNVLRLRDAIMNADGILLATPVYNYAAASSAKNVVELTGSAWTNKVAGFLCAAGGSHSYMSIMALANSLMLDFRVHVIPRFVYSTEADYAPDYTPAPEISARVRELAGALVAVATALNQSGCIAARQP